MEFQCSWFKSVGCVGCVRCVGCVESVESVDCVRCVESVGCELCFKEQIESKLLHFIFGVAKLYFDVWWRCWDKLPGRVKTSGRTRTSGRARTGDRARTGSRQGEDKQQYKANGRTRTSGRARTGSPGEDKPHCPWLLDIFFLSIFLFAGRRKGCDEKAFESDGFVSSRL